jgi:hypothetical protein
MDIALRLDVCKKRPEFLRIIHAAPVSEYYSVEYDDIYQKIYPSLILKTVNFIFLIQ